MHTRERKAGNASPRTHTQVIGIYSKHKMEAECIQTEPQSNTDMLKQSIWSIYSPAE